MLAKQIIFLVVGAVAFLFIYNEWSRKDSYNPPKLQHASIGKGYGTHHVPMGGGMMADWAGHGSHHALHHALHHNIMAGHGLHHVGGKQISVTSMNYTNGQTPTIIFDDANQPLTLNKPVTLVIADGTATYEDGPEHIDVPYPVRINGVWVSGSIGQGEAVQGINPTSLSHAASVFISKMAGSPYGGSLLANITGFLYQN